jgi:hypothetical protein
MRLRLKPTYQELIGIALDDNAYVLEFPDRSTKAVRRFVLSDGWRGKILRDTATTTRAA